MITQDQLKTIMPRMARNPKTCATLYPYLISAMEEAGINTPLREAAFLAQVAHESAELRYMEEIWGPTAQQLKYEPPNDLGVKRLGNTQAGDGYKFRGAGPIQVTGRSNFERAAKDLGMALDDLMDIAHMPAGGFKLAAWYWNYKNLNVPADAGDFDTVTKKINGGFIGKAERDAYYAKAKEVLDC